MPWIIDKIRDILPNRPYGKTAKDFRVARLIDLNRVIDSINEGFENIGSSAPVDVTYTELYNATVIGEHINVDIIDYTFDKTFEANIIIPGESDLEGYEVSYNSFQEEDKMKIDSFVNLINLL